MADWIESTEGSKETRITKDEWDKLQVLHKKVPMDYRKNSNTFRRYNKYYNEVLAKYGYNEAEVSGISLMGYIRVLKK